MKMSGLLRLRTRHFGHRRFVPSALQTGQKALEIGVLIQFLAQQMAKIGVSVSIFRASARVQLEAFWPKSRPSRPNLQIVGLLKLVGRI